VGAATYRGGSFHRDIADPGFLINVWEVSIEISRIRGS